MLGSHESSGYPAFAFELQTDCLLSSWLLYADGSNYIIDKWHEAVFGFVNSRHVIGTETVHVSIDEWNQRVDHVHYFWFSLCLGIHLTQVTPRSCSVGLTAS